MKKILKGLLILATLGTTAVGITSCGSAFGELKPGQTVQLTLENANTYLSIWNGLDRDYSDGAYHGVECELDVIGYYNDVLYVDCRISGEWTYSTMNSVGNYDTNTISTGVFTLDKYGYGNKKIYRKQYYENLIDVKFSLTSISGYFSKK